MSHISEDTAIIRPTLHHINLKTTRLQEMIEWYGTVVGMKSNYHFPGGAWLTNDEANHRLALLTSPQLSENPNKLIHTGLHHSAFEYTSIDDLLHTYTRLKGLGIEPHACLDHGMTTSFYYEDPDGNSVELQVDNFGNWQESSEWMRTAPQFAANPIGMPIDADQMVAARQAGASFAELHQRAYAGEFKPSGPLDLHVPLGDPRSPL
ncbi:MAG: VOC family protein [Ktedonobacteraceae bacterium]|nr:VOC family protein [Ktedonobacteraceae bacterium]